MKPIDKGCLAREVNPPGRADAVTDQIEPAGGGNGGIELPYAARGGVPRIGEDGLAFLLPFPVQLPEILDVHVDLAPYVYFLGRLPIRRNPQGDGLHGHNVAPDVFPREPVAPRSRSGEQTVFVRQLYGEAVVLGLHRVVDLFRRLEKPLDPFVKLPQLVVREGVFEGEHGLGMGDLPEFLCRGRPDPLCGRLRENVIPAFFHLKQTPIEAVVLLVRNDRRVAHIIEIAMTVEILDESFHLDFCVFRHRLGHRVVLVLNIKMRRGRMFKIIGDDKKTSIHVFDRLRKRLSLPRITYIVANFHNYL